MLITSTAVLLELMFEMKKLLGWARKVLHSESPLKRVAGVVKSLDTAKLFFSFRYWIFHHMMALGMNLMQRKSFLLHILYKHSAAPSLP